MKKKALQWHPAFQAALQIEFMEESCRLEFLKEFNLTENRLFQHQRLLQGNRVHLHLSVQHRKRTGNSSRGAYHLTGCQPLSQEAGRIFKGSLSCGHLSKISWNLLCDGTHVPAADSDSPQAFQRRVHLAEPSSDEPEPSGGHRTACQSLCRERKEPALRGGHGFHCTCKLEKI